MKDCKQTIDPILNRLNNLDYLRGLAAFGIMIYHYLSVTLGKFFSESFMGRIGIYGVSIFYVLSGLTLFYVYNNQMKPSIEDTISFFKKRIFRIFPLLWLVTIFSVILSRKVPDFLDLFLTLSGLFGFINWDPYFSGGVWSIGNELVFYVLFPFLMLFIKKFKLLMTLLSTIILGLYIYFAYIKLDSNITFDEQWINYINPLNQVFLFLGGFLIGSFLCNSKIRNSFLIILLFFSILLFTFYPTKGDIIFLVTGTNRLVFTACCFMICISFYKMTLKFPKVIHNPLISLGKISYSVYLLHPIIWTLTAYASKVFIKYFFYFPEFFSLILSVIFTLLISYYVYKYFEKYFMKLGHIIKNNR